MHRFTVVGAGLLSIAGFAGAASAADLPARTYTKAPPIVAPVYDWSVFYIGLNGGGAASHGCWNLTNIAGAAVPAAPSEGCNTASGGLVGGQVGYRWQSVNWVFGVEAQGDWADLRGSNASLVALIPYNNFTKVDAIGLFTGQVGYPWNNTLVYVKGGAAVTDNKYEGLFAGTGVAIDRSTETRWGASVGAGLEYSFAPSWSVGVEYDHLFMGRDNNTFTSVFLVQGINTRTDSIRQDVDLATVRLNYRFGGPVIAKY